MTLGAFACFRSDADKKITRELIGVVKNARVSGAVLGALELSSLNVLRVCGQKSCAFCFATTKRPVKRP